MVSFVGRNSFALRLGLELFFSDKDVLTQHRFEPDYVPLCAELTKEYIDEINKTTPEGLLEQLEDPSEEDYKYMEVLEETSGEQEEDTIEVLENNEDSLITQSTKTQEQKRCLVTQRDSDATSYVPQKKKFQTTLPNVASVPCKRPKTSSKNNDDTSLKNNTDTSSTFLTSKQLSKELKNDKDSETNYEQIYLTSENKSSIELFFESMAQTVKKLPRKAQADIKLNICKIVTEAEVEYVSSSGTEQNTQSIFKSPAALPKLVLIPCNMLDKKDKKQKL